MIALVIAASLGLPQLITDRWSVCLPDGLKVNKSAYVDFDRDGLTEVVVVGTIIDAASRWGEMDDSHTVVMLMMWRGGKWEASPCKEAGQHFERLQLADLDGDRVPEILVFGRFWGADNLTATLSVFKGGKKGLTAVDRFVGVNGVVEARDYSRRGRIEIKASNEYWGPEESHAQAHRTISVYFRFASGRIKPYRALLHDHKADAVRAIDTHSARQLLGSRTGFQPEKIPAPINLEPNLLTKGLTDCAAPSWSPDGKSIAFVAGWGLYDTHNRLQPNDVWVIKADGTGRRRLTSFGDSLVDSTQWSPDGKHIAFRRMPENDDSKDRGYWLYTVADGKLRQIDDDIAVASWAADSTALVRDGDVVPIDGKPKRQLGKKEQVPSIPWDQTEAAGVKAQRHLNSIEFSIAGAQRTLVFKPGANVEPALSPDGSRLAFSSYKFGTWGIWVAKLPGLFR